MSIFNDDFVLETMKRVNVSKIKEHHIEQIKYRIYLCKDCIIEKKCKFCSCNPMDKILEPLICNPKSINIMNEEKWNLFKKQNNVQ